MKLNNETLRRALKDPAALASKRTPLLVLNCVKISASGGKLTIAATNLDAYRESIIPCEGDFTETCVHAGRLQQLLSDFGAGDVEFNLSPNGSRIELSGRHSAKLPTVRQEEKDGKVINEFPAAPEVKGQPIGNLKALADAIQSVAWAAGNAPDRTNLHGVCVRGDQTCATTGRTLALYTMDAPVEQELFIPSAAVTMICERIRCEDAQLIVGETHLFATSVGEMLAIKKPETTFVDYRRAIPTEPRFVGSLDKSALIETIRPAASMYDAIFSKTRMEFGPTGCVVSQASDTGDFDSTIPGSFKPLKFAANGKFLIEAAGKFDGDIEIYGADQFSPLLLKSGPLMVILCALAW